MLHITSPTGHYLDVLHQELTFQIGVQKFKKFKKLNRETGETEMIEVPAGIAYEKKAFYTQEGDDFVTINGYFERVYNCLKKYGFSVEYVFCGTSPGRPRPEPIIDDITFGLHLGKENQMREEQRECLINLLSSPEGGVADMAMGSGKTHVIAGLIRAYRNSRGIITVRQKSIVHRLSGGLESLVAGSGATLGIKVSGTKYKEGSFIITTDRGLASFDDNAVDVVVADECHGFGAPNVAEVLAKLPNSIKYGLSGTTKRQDGKHKIVEGFFGPVCFEYTDKEAEGDGRVVPVKVFMPEILTGPLVKSGYQKIKREKIGIWENRERNSLIADICSHAPKDQQLLVFVRTKTHLDELLPLLGPDFIEIHAGLNPKVVVERQKGFETGELLRVVSTDVLGVGIDPANLRIVVDANWTTSDQTMLQRLGRNRRHADGKSYGVLVRPWDSWWDESAGRSKTAAASYRKRGMEVKKISTIGEIEWDR